MPLRLPPWMSPAASPEAPTSGEPGRLESSGRLPPPARSPSSGPSRSRRRQGDATTGGEGEVLRRVSFPAALDRALEARLAVTGETRDEALASLLMGGLLAQPQGEPPWLSRTAEVLEERLAAARDAFASQIVESVEATKAVDTGISAALSRFNGAVQQVSTLSRSHQAWLSSYESSLAASRDLLDRARMDFSSALGDVGRLAADQAQFERALKAAFDGQIEACETHAKEFRGLLKQMCELQKNSLDLLAEESNKSAQRVHNVGAVYLGCLAAFTVGSVALLVVLAPAFDGIETFFRTTPLLWPFLGVVTAFLGGWMLSTKVGGR